MGNVLSYTFHNYHARVPVVLTYVNSWFEWPGGPLARRRCALP
jgi:hypothetical protein